jgi:IS30 family transposase
MTEYQIINAARLAENIKKIIASTQEPATFKQIAEASGLHHCNISTIIRRNEQLFKYLGKVSSVDGKKHKQQNLYQAKFDAELSPIIPSKGGTTYNLQDDARYHDNMRMLRENRKPLKVYVAGSTLS